MTIRANVQMKRNVKALLRSRGMSRKDLAMWCHKTESWISKILDEDQDRRVFPMKYYDRIADFLGVSVYQLFQPGVEPTMERRHVTDRRSMVERRTGRLGAATTLPLTPRVAAAQMLAYFNDDELPDLMKFLGEQLRGRRFQPSPGNGVAGQGSTGGTRGASGHVKTTQRAKGRVGKRGGSAQGASDG